VSHTISQIDVPNAATVGQKCFEGKLEVGTKERRKRKIASEKNK
jgi:hypothetical protein